jgi:nucleotide-binding universal stress UspA family protein
VETSPEILIAVDDSEASYRALHYVGTIVGRGTVLRLRLFHALPPMPPELLEGGGSENPELEAKEEADVHAAQRRWLAEAEAAAEPLFARCKEILRSAQISDSVIATACAPSDGAENVASTILAASQSHGCNTIVVGRTAFSRFHALFHRHVGDELISRGQDRTIWVVE